MSAAWRAGCIPAAARLLHPCSRQPARTYRVVRRCVPVVHRCTPLRHFSSQQSPGSHAPPTSSSSLQSQHANPHSLLAHHPGDVLPDDIEEPDESRKEAHHAHEPGHAPGDEAAGSVGLQGINLADVAAETAAPAFTLEEIEALVVDLKTYQSMHPVDAAHIPAVPLAVPPVAAPDSATGGTAPRPRTFLASWSVKEVCAWYLQIEEQLHQVGAVATAPDGTPHPNSFLHLLVKHRIDGARLMTFTSEPALIPFVPPGLLSRILYLLSLSSSSQLYSQHSDSNLLVAGGGSAGGVVGGTLSTDPNMRHLEAILGATVKIFCTSTSPDFARPWQQLDQAEASSSGFVISGRRILCNAHGVTHATSLRVRKHGDATKYKATVHVISHEADLAVLHVAVDAFWEGVTPLKFGAVPRLQDTVVVVGFPTGGDSICVTKGVVSRVLVSNYVHSEEALLTLQIDAAINAGNSGGPVLLNGSVVGVAFQGIGNLQSVGFIIPVPVVHHFLSDLSLHGGRYTGFPSFAGLTFQKLEHEGLKRYLGLTQPDETGILLMEVAPCDGAKGVLQPGDVVTHIDGTPVADDGSIFFRSGERISARYIPASKFVGDDVRVSIVRDRKRMDVKFHLHPRRSLVPTNLYDQQPSYLIVAGLVFTPLTRPYLVDTYGRSWAKRAPIDLIRLAYYGTLEREDQEVIILSTILVDDVNAGYGANFHNIELRTLNGIRVDNMRHLVRLVDEQRRAGVPFLRFDFTLSRVIILDSAEAFTANTRILQQNNIEHDRSAELRAQAHDEADTRDRAAAAGADVPPVAELEP